MAESGRAAEALARYGFLSDPAGRARRCRRIVELLRTFVDPDLSRMSALDIGCSAGLITRDLAAQMQWTVGMDIDAQSVVHASAHHAIADRLAFVRGSGEALPFSAAAFDLVLCNHVYEHVHDSRNLMAEIARVLKPGGACWFAAGHTLQLIEPHFRIPLLSMVPRPLASAIVRAAGRGASYEIRFLPPWRIPELFAPFAETRLVSADALRDPVRYELADGVLGTAAIRAIVRTFATACAWIAPTQLWILRKR